MSKAKRELLAFYVECKKTGDTTPKYYLAGIGCETLDIDTGLERESDSDVTKSVTGQGIKNYTMKISGTGKYTTEDPVYAYFDDLWYNETAGGSENTNVLVVEVFNQKRAKQCMMSLGVKKLGGSAGSYVEFDLDGEQVTDSVKGSATIDATAKTATFTPAP